MRRWVVEAVCDLLQRASDKFSLSLTWAVSEKVSPTCFPRRACWCRPWRRSNLPQRLLEFWVAYYYIGENLISCNVWFGEMIYGKVLQKRFHKISLSLKDLRFKILSIRVWRLGQVKKKIEEIAASWESHQKLKSFDKCYLFWLNVVLNTYF